MQPPFAIAFWGSPPISAALLNSLLLDHRFAVKFVVTQQDKPRSTRGRQLLPSPVKQLAQEAKLTVFTPESLKKEKSLIGHATLENKILFHVILAYGKIIPQELFDQPPLKSVNFHASLLPLLRGASPVETALLLDFPETGWSLQRLTTELDAGDVYGQIKVSIAPEDDAVSLYQKLQQALLTHGPDMLASYARGELIAKPQVASQATFCHKLTTQEARLNFHEPVMLLRAKARAFAARGGVYAFLSDGRRVKIQADLKALANSHLSLTNQAPGTLVTQPRPAIVAKDGLFWISGLQVEGRRMMSVTEFLNGYGKNVVFT